MGAALASTVAHPERWAMALAAFLVRGGIVIVALPIIPLPSTASLTNLLAPSVESLMLSGPSSAQVIVGTLVVGAVLATAAGAALTGSWLDVVQLRETTVDPEVDLTWRVARPSAAAALGIRLVAHLPTFAAGVIAALRIVDLTYAELLSPSDAAVPVAVRVLGRAPDVISLLVLTWLVGETVGGLAARRYAAGELFGEALRRSLRQVVSARAAVTLVATDAVLLIALVPFLAATGRAWDHVRSYLLDGADGAALTAAMLLLITTWLLGLSLLAIALAWRATAWTLVVAPTTVPAGEPIATPAPEVVAG
jgi:hypothetical protein